MAFTFTVKKWEETRPTKAKGSGVAKGITAVAAATRKQATAMNEAEVETARKAVDQLVDAFDVATGKLQSSRDTKAMAAKRAITDWRKECTDYLDDLKKRLYAIRLQKVVTTYNALYVENRDKLVSAHAAASNSRQAIARGGAAPENKVVMDWFNAARDTIKFCSKTEIQKLHIDGVPKGAVNFADVPLPPDLSTTKAKIKELSDWCTEFAKGAKRAGRAAGAGLDDSQAVEKELKAILDQYGRVEQEMKPIIQRATQLAALAKQKTDAMKAAIQQGTTDERVIKPLTTDVRNIRLEVERLDAEVARVNSSYREGNGAIAQRASAWRKMPGYDATRHGQILTKRQEAAFMGIRRATMPIAEARRQVERAKDLMSKSTNHRGYAGAI
jgi:hypothetical protein